MAPSGISDLALKFFSPEIAAYQWAHDKVLGVPSHDDHVAVQESPARIVEYIAAGCPHCQHLQPVWKTAAHQWQAQQGDLADRLAWEKRECFDVQWKPGKDIDECRKRGVNSFPSIRLFPADSTGANVEFNGKRNSESLVNFAKDVLDGKTPVPDGVDAEPPIALPADLQDTMLQFEQPMDTKLTYYYSAACPHSKEFAPTFAQAEVEWNKDEDVKNYAPPVRFIKKECYDERWRPGKDAAECMQQRIDHFPTVRLFTADPLSGHYNPLGDFPGPRKAESMKAFIMAKTGASDMKALVEAEENSVKDASQAESGAAGGTTVQHKDRTGAVTGAGETGKAATRPAGQRAKASSEDVAAATKALSIQVQSVPPAVLAAAACGVVAKQQTPGARATRRRPLAASPHALFAFI